MYNRTNRTLSANLNRLNLGTRSLAFQAGANIGGQTLRIRHAHAVVLRDGMVGVAVEPMCIGTWRMTEIPGSFPVPPQPPLGVTGRPVVALDADADVRPATFGPVHLPTVERLCGRGESQRQSQTRSRSSQGPAKPSRKPFTGKRLYSGRGVGRTAVRATVRTFAARVAAAGG